jgi:UTP--glucose-1-phosphate uridylyltransferase
MSDIRITKAVMPVAGEGKRFLPHSKVLPKMMYILYDKPIIEYVLIELEKSGIRDVLLVCSSSENVFKKYYGDSVTINGTRISLSYVMQQRARGLPDAILCAKEFVKDEAFVVALPDMLLFGNPTPTKLLIDNYTRLNVPLVYVKSVPYDNLKDFGIIDYDSVDKNTFKLKLMHRPSSNDDLPQNRVYIGDYGRYIFTKDVFDIIFGLLKKYSDKEIPTIELFNMMLKSGDVYGLTSDVESCHIGDIRSYIESWRYIFDNYD